MWCNTTHPAIKALLDDDVANNDVLVFFRFTKEGQPELLTNDTVHAIRAHEPPEFGGLGALPTIGGSFNNLGRDAVGEQLEGAQLGAKLHRTTERN